MFKSWRYRQDFLFSNFEWMYDVAVIGGGLAGLINSILLRGQGFEVVLFDEKGYPFHRVCGEYISNEVIPFLKQHDLFPSTFAPSDITKFRLSSISGKSFRMDLDLGGFGISRYSYDHWLAKKAKGSGVDLHEGERVTKIDFAEDVFEIETSKSNYTSRVAIGSFGKRAKLDKDLNRNFVGKRSPYVGVKYHIKTEEVDGDVVELHNFKGGYCGVSRINGDTFNLCYLTHRDNLKNHKKVGLMEENVLHENPHLQRIYNHSEFLFDQPVVINEISFKPKEPVHNHILMSGDSAGMIAPLCGNGMAMAIHSAKILSEYVTCYLKGELTWNGLEQNYSNHWKRAFAIRHWAGRKIQSLFGSPGASEIAINAGNSFPSFARFLMRQTHGKPF